VVITTQKAFLDPCLPEITVEKRDPAIELSNQVDIHYDPILIKGSDLIEKINQTNTVTKISSPSLQFLNPLKT